MREWVMSDTDGFGGGRNKIRVEMLLRSAVHGPGTISEARWPHNAWPTEITTLPQRRNALAAAGGAA
jgi:hypothetical protein